MSANQDPNNKILKHYVSEIDLFMEQFDKLHPEKSKSQRKEIAKYQRIYRLRDDAECSEFPKKLWDAF